MSLAGNGIGIEGAKQLAKSLAHNATLMSVELAGNLFYIVTPALLCVHIRMCMWVFYNHAIVK